MKLIKLKKQICEMYKLETNIPLSTDIKNHLLIVFIIGKVKYPIRHY